jgi:hypothetical protein
MSRQQRLMAGLFCAALLLVWIAVSGLKSPNASAQTPTKPPSPRIAPPASSFSTFYCDYPFDQYTPYFHLDPTKKVSLHVGTNPKHYRLSVHDPAGATVVAILGGSTTLPIPNIPATIDVEAAKIEIQNNGAQPADACYYPSIETVPTGRQGMSCRMPFPFLRPKSPTTSGFLAQYSRKIRDPTLRRNPRPNHAKFESSVDTPQPPGLIGLAFY